MWQILATSYLFGNKIQGKENTYSSVNRLNQILSIVTKKKGYYLRFVLDPNINIYISCMYGKKKGLDHCQLQKIDFVRWKK